MSAYLIFILIIAVISLLLLNNYSARLFDNLYKFGKSITFSALKGILEDQYVKSFGQKFPRFKKFLHKRFMHTEFHGRVLTILILVFAYVLSLFLGVVESVMKSEIIVNVDLRLSQLMIFLHQPKLTIVYLWITAIGKPFNVFLLAGIISVLFWLWDKRKYILPFWISILGSAAFVTLSKAIFQRTRPIYPVYFESSNSFPSWHAAVAVAVFGFLAYFAVKNIRRKKYQTTAVVIAVIIIFIIGLSRIYLNVHYMSDVWAGDLLGLLWLIIGISLAEWQLRRPFLHIFTVPILPIKRKRFLAFGLIIFWLLAYISYTRATFPTLNYPMLDKPPLFARDAFETFSQTGLPRYSESITAAKQEPLSFMIVASQADFLKIMAAAGWTLADSVSLKSLEKSAKAALLDQAYPQAPMTPSFWDGEVNAYGFEKMTTENSIRQRHHARFWDTNLITKDNKRVFVGTASFDSNIKWGVTHQIAPDIDTEREILFQDLQKTSFLKNFHKEMLVSPVMGKNFTGDPFFTDGMVYILEL